MNGITTLITQAAILEEAHVEQTAVVGMEERMANGPDTPMAWVRKWADKEPQSPKTWAVEKRADGEPQSPDIWAVEKRADDETQSPGIWAVEK